MSATSSKLAYTLSIAIAILAGAASASALLLGSLYRDNSLVATAWKGNDLITLIVVVPLLVGSLMLATRGSDRARLLWLGCVGYMLYNYIFYLYGAAFNIFFLVYVALVALALYTFILGLLGLDVKRISREFASGTPMRRIAVLMLLIPVIMGTIELLGAASFVFTGQVPADVVRTGDPTSVVYATDLALLMPAIAIAAILLWRRRPFGYVLAPVLMVKGVTYPLALITMSLIGTWDSLTPVYAFFWLVSLAALGLLLWNLRGEAGREEERQAMPGATGAHIMGS
jgi:hypothetical protein